MTTISKLSKWSENAPQCSCKREKVSYICPDVTCPLFQTRKLFCQQCLLDKLHRGCDFKDAKSFASESEKSWTDFKEVVDKLVNKGMKAYSTFEPLIKYLESETINAKALPPGFRYITADIERLKNLEMLVN